MKPFLIASALVVLATGAAHAQGGPGASFGLKGGASLTSFTGNGTEDAKYLWGFHAGVLANFAVNDVFSVQPEVLYSMKGAKGQETIQGVTIQESIRLHYIDVPLLAHLNAGGLFFEVGPQIGFAVAANAHAEATGYGSQDQDIKDQVNTVDFGYAGGLGYQLANGPGIGLRYNGGFTNVDKSNNSSSSTRNSAFQLYVTYMFGKK